MVTYSTKDVNLKIKSWAEEDRPREKLLLKGKSVLSDAELIAILIGSGTKELSAVSVAKNILSANGNNLNELAKLSVQDLMKFKGVGGARAISSISALELGRRRKQSESIKRPKINACSQVYEYMKPEMLDLLHEEFWIILLNRANVVIKKTPISLGGLSGTVADPKVIFKIALENTASSIVLVHNHPSGNLDPSSADVKLTKRLKEAGELLDVQVLDHIIFTNEAYLSFADEGTL